MKHLQAALVYRNLSFSKVMSKKVKFPLRLLTSTHVAKLRKTWNEIKYFLWSECLLWSWKFIRVVSISIAKRISYHFFWFSRKWREIFWSASSPERKFDLESFYVAMMMEQGIEKINFHGRRQKLCDFLSANEAETVPRVLVLQTCRKQRSGKGRLNEASPIKATCFPLTWDY